MRAAIGSSCHYSCDGTTTLEPNEPQTCTKTCTEDWTGRGFIRHEIGDHLFVSPSRRPECPCWMAPGFIRFVRSVGGWKRICASNVFENCTTRHPPTAQTYFYLSMVEGAHKKLLCNTYPQSVIRVVVVVVVAACPGRVGGGGCVKKSCHRVAFSANSFWFITMQFFFAFTFC